MSTRKQNPERASSDDGGTEDLSESGWNSEVRRQRIATAAYYRAQNRGFPADGELEDWLAAEQDIDGQQQGEQKA